MIFNMEHPIPFRYPGGKFYALKILEPFWQAVEHNEYREPMAGGATVFFSKPKSEFNWLNDLDSELITTYKILKNPKLRKKLAEELGKEIASPTRWREVYSFVPQNDYEIAYKYFYLNRTSFSGKLSSPAWGYRPKRSLPPERWHERILPCGEMLEKVNITCEDFSKVILAPSKSGTCLLYVDPPYFTPPTHKHYRYGFEREDHIRLCELLKNTEHKFFLTYDDCPEIRSMYSWAKIYPIKFFYRVDNSGAAEGKRNLGFELVITNYEVPGLKTLEDLDND